MHLFEGVQTLSGDLTNLLTAFVLYLINWCIIQAIFLIFDVLSYRNSDIAQLQVKYACQI
jgi:hypothetical protein